jgi:hypothetical protein
MLPPLVASQAKLRAEFGCIGSIWQKSCSSAGMLFSCANRNLVMTKLLATPVPTVAGFPLACARLKCSADAPGDGEQLDLERLGERSCAPRSRERSCASRSRACLSLRCLTAASACICSIGALRVPSAHSAAARPASAAWQFRGGSSRGATALLPTFSSYEHELWAVRHASGLLFPKKRLASSPTLSQRIDRLSFVLIIRFISQSAITAPRPIPDRDREHARTSNALCICANFNAFEREFCRDVVCAVRERSAVSAPIAGFERSRRRRTSHYFAEILLRILLRYDSEVLPS